MFDESSNISAKSWKRTVDNINKVGYSDGVIDGETASFQSSFDIGYKQGLNLGLEFGYKEAIGKTASESHPIDQRNINCQICLKRSALSDNVGNLFNTQKERNDEYLRK